MRYPRIYDISYGARCELYFYNNGSWLPTSYDLNDRSLQELIDRRYIEIRDNKVVVLVKHPRVYKRDRKGNIIPMKMDEGKAYSPRWK